MSIPGWDAKIAEAQLVTSYVIEGVARPRIAYGAESDDWGAGAGRPCHDCDVQAGQFHVPSCDVERCPVCDGQAIGCDCNYEDDDDDEQ